MKEESVKKETSEISSEELADSIIRGMQEKKAEQIVRIDLRDVHQSICDYFVICHGRSNTQIEGIARSVEEQTRKELGEKPWHTEGRENAQWVLLDYVNVVAHIFDEEARSFFDLESLWADAIVEPIEHQT